MAWFIGQSLLIIALSFLLGLLVGWLLWARRRPLSSKEDGRIVAAGVQDATVPISGIEEPAEPAALVTPPAEEAEPVEAEAAPAEPVEAAPAEAEPAPVEAVVVEEVETVVVEEAVAVAPVEEAPAQETPAEVEPVVAQAEEVAPVAVVVPKQPAKKASARKAAVPGPIDDLKRIEGIGPKMSAALYAAGISTYSDLAAADEPKLRSAIETAGLRFAPSIVTWASQAQLLADGDEAGFADLTRRLVAGRDTGRA